MKLLILILLSTTLAYGQGEQQLKTRKMVALFSAHVFGPTVIGTTSAFMGDGLQWAGPGIGFGIVLVGIWGTRRTDKKLEKL